MTAAEAAAAAEANRSVPPDERETAGGRGGVRNGAVSPSGECGGRGAGRAEMIDERRTSGCARSARC